MKITVTFDSLDEFFDHFRQPLGDQHRLAVEAKKAEEKTEPKEPVKAEEPVKVEPKELVKAEESKGPSLEDMQQATIALVRARGKQAAKDIFAEFGASSASTVPEDKRAEVIARFQEVLNADCPF